MTTSWNDHIASLEEKLEPAALAATNLFRKNRALLQKYFNEYNQWYNTKETMSYKYSQKLNFLKLPFATLGIQRSLVVGKPRKEVNIPSNVPTKDSFNIKQPNITNNRHIIGRKRKRFRFNTCQTCGHIISAFKSKHQEKMHNSTRR